MLDELFGELTALASQQVKIEARLQQINAAIQAIQNLAAESDEPLIEPPSIHPDDETGFTDKVREILKSNPLKRLTAVEIRDMLVKSSAESDPKIVLIHTHNTLKRLHKQGEVDELKAAEGRNAYHWI